MTDKILLLPILLPFFASILLLILPEKVKPVKEILSLSISAILLAISILMFGRNFNFTAPWAGFGFDLSLRLYHFSSFIFLAVSGFIFLIEVFSLVFMRDKENSRLFFAYLLLSASFTNGAVFANSLVVLLFFWEGLLIPLFGMIMAGGKGSYRTAVKAVIISGAADLCMMLGACITVYLSGGINTMDRIHIPMGTMGGWAFILLMIGAMAKAGAMPFHSWIPDAAADAPMPFMALFPASLEKLLGIYMLARISLDMFDLKSGSPISTAMMTIGAATIIFAVMMALIQKNYKKLLSYHAISQVGYMILGIGTAVPAGIVGGLFHMVNNAMYKSCLFLTGGAVERQTGTADLRSLGGLWSKMPVTFACFIISAAAISGIPPLNGFFSKELIFDGALKGGIIFYIAAAAGAFFTAASFLKLGHAVYLGKGRGHTGNIREAPWPMLLPMIITASGCILFGVYNPLPLRLLIEPVLGSRLEQTVSGLPHNWLLAGISMVIPVLAFLNHRYGFKRTKSGLGAADHIHYAPVLKKIYGWAELGYFDPYNIGRKAVGLFTKLAMCIDGGIDWIYCTAAAGLVKKLSSFIKRLHMVRQSMYLGWSIAGMLIVIIIAILSI
jgi:NADH-quinone oxidoreductase subunit L